jgi:inner membrane protein
MDSITHLLMGLSLYAAVDKRNLSKKEKNALLLCTVVGSEIPDSDVISSLWDSEGRYQMWHRGITHSIFMVPFFAALLAGIGYLIARVNFLTLFLISALAVAIHNSIDLFNAWGTGYLEPFSSVRLTFGVIPIVDLVFWATFLVGFLFVRFKLSKWQGFQVFRVVWLFIALHIVIQSAQGIAIYSQFEPRYEEVVLSADFVPGVFTVVGKIGEVVELHKGSLWTEFKRTEELISAENADLSKLFAENKRAKTLLQWSPFVVIVDNDERIGIFDPRFYRNGESFLYEFIEK